jgi:LacI family transcriptional regulator
MRDITSDKQVEHILTRLLDRGLDGVVVEDGVSKVLIDLCRRTGHTMPALAVLNAATRRTLPAHYVLSDFEFGAWMGTKHLLSLDRRRILFVIHRNLYLKDLKGLEEVPGIYGDVIRGYKRALAEAGLSKREMVFTIDHEFAQESEDRTRMKALLTGPDRPDAVFAFGDYRAKHVIDIADEVGLRVPEDLSVIGYWNTPWAEMTRVPLTSISIREEEIAQIAAEKLIADRMTGKHAGEPVILEPKLVIRGSCGHTVFATQS